jgi:hypothetical protein
MSKQFVLLKVDKFIEENNLTNFSVYGDFNFSFRKEIHKSKAMRFKQFMNKYSLFDLDEKLNKHVDFTWFGTGDRGRQTSKIDFFMTNLTCFSDIRYKFFSYSDHKIVSVTFKKQFI